jgi:hypothetical protein
MSTPAVAPSPAMAAVMATLDAVATGAPVVLDLIGGGRVGPSPVVGRLSGQAPRGGTTVAVRLGTGDVVHLGDVAHVRPVTDGLDPSMKRAPRKLGR